MRFSLRSACLSRPWRALFAVWVLICGWLVVGPAPALRAGTVELLIQNPFSIEAPIYLAIYRDEDQELWLENINDFVVSTFWANHAVHKSQLELSSGDYAFVAYIDKNGNAALDRNWLKNPQEPVGYSSTGANQFGAVNFQNAMIKISPGYNQLVIYIK